MSNLELLADIDEVLEALEFARTRDKPSWGQQYLFGKKSQPHTHAAITQLTKRVAELRQHLEGSKKA